MTIKRQRFTTQVYFDSLDASISNSFTFDFLTTSIRPNPLHTNRIYLCNTCLWTIREPPLINEAPSSSLTYIYRTDIYSKNSACTRHIPQSKPGTLHLSSRLILDSILIYRVIVTQIQDSRIHPNSQGG